MKKNGNGNGRKVATYVVVGVLIFTMVFSVFATLVAAIK